MVQFEEALIDRFGLVPFETRELFKTMELKWLGMEMGFEKITFRKKALRLYFPGDENAPVFQSKAFEQLMQYVVNNPSKFSMKQTVKALILTINPVQNMAEAMDMLSQLGENIEVKS